MGWEQRGNQSYYYRKTRRGRRVISEYIGAGEGAQLIYLMDESEREEARINQNAWKKTKSENQAIDLEIDRLNRKIMTLVKATILVSGYHIHKGQWRKLRNG
jgi:hypothetical protein